MQLIMLGVIVSIFLLTLLIIWYADSPNIISLARYQFAWEQKFTTNIGLQNRPFRPLVS